MQFYGSPGIVQLCNAHMHGVDKFDSGINLYRFEHRQRKWTKTVFYNARLKTGASQAWRFDRIYLMQKKFLLKCAL